MATHASIPANLDKEIIPYLHFPKEDVLISEEDRKIRKIKLENATAIGNIEHSKVAILFEDINGLRRVVTTIWATTQESIVLKKGSTIPIHRVVDVELV
jgi:uncharacterized protein (UPF0248 family)